MTTMKLMMPKGQKPVCLASLTRIQLPEHRHDQTVADARPPATPCHAAESDGNAHRVAMGAGAAAALFLALAPALAQTTSPPAQSPGSSSGTASAPVRSPSQVDEGQLNILPSVGNAGPSAAPTMIFNCKERPKECTEQVKPGDKQTAPKLSN